MEGVVYHMTEDELRSWMDAEFVRLGSWSRGFEISWHSDEDSYSLEVWSLSSLVSGDHPYGAGNTVLTIRDTTGSCLPEIQRAGRKLYYQLRNTYEIHKDLGRK